MYQVQSISEWAPNTTTMQSMLSRAIRSGVYRRRGRFSGRVGRRASRIQLTSKASATSSPTIPRSASVWTTKPWAWVTTSVSVR